MRDVITMNYLELLKLAAPETIVVVTALTVLAADLVALRGLELRFRLIIGALISCVGCADRRTPNYRVAPDHAAAIQCGITPHYRIAPDHRGSADQSVSPDD